MTITRTQWTTTSTAWFRRWFLPRRFWTLFWSRVVSVVVVYICHRVKDGTRATDAQVSWHRCTRRCARKSARRRRVDSNSDNRQRIQLVFFFIINGLYVLYTFFKCYVFIEIDMNDTRCIALYTPILRSVWVIADRRSRAKLEIFGATCWRKCGVQLFPTRIDFMWWYTHGTGYQHHRCVCDPNNHPLKIVAVNRVVLLRLFNEHIHELSQKCSLSHRLDLNNQRYQFICWCWISHHMLIQSNSWFAHLFFWDRIQHMNISNGYLWER